MSSMLLHPKSLGSHRVSRALQIGLGTLLIVGMAGVVVLLAMGRLAISDAIFLAATPWVLFAAAFRPDWLLVLFVALPATVTSSIQPRRVAILVAVALVMLLVTRRRVTIGAGTSLVTLIAIYLAGRIYLGDVGSDALASNEAIMENLMLYILLALLAFNLAVLEEVNGDHLATALIIGVLGTLLTGLAGYGGVWFPNGSAILTKTYLGPLASMALGVCFARLLTDDPSGRTLGALLVTAALLWLTIFSRVRAAWLAAAITFFVLAFRWRRQGYFLVLAVAIAVALLSTTVRQEVAGDESGDIVGEFQSGDIATGRWTLWSALWERGETGLPWGNGFGYMWSLSSEDLFDVTDQFQSEESGVVPPHNDFIYLFVEFGIPGVLLVIFFWLGLFRARRRVSHSADPSHRRDSWLFLGAIVTGLSVAMFDDVFAVRPFAERLFPVAGFIIGLSTLQRVEVRRVEGTLD
jgi:hypothetical protein